ncbi:transcription factor CYCLOIDEA [Helianthus annuus]|uniref:transcription factor CYCLOIDEA n=1 Tax=Helianthus annuus TaxID=4232 RepID=UPI001652D2CD|nr:transcription factor CYCLOIDEA [Helianthus annuus]
MYPSFTSTTFQTSTCFSLYNCINNTNVSITHCEDYCPPLSSPHYITLDDGNMIFDDLLQQESLFSNDYINHNANNIAVHQELSSPDIRASLQAAMGKCSNNNGDDGFSKPKTSSKRRRASKADRHSKINTAQGPRGRRMRLSVEVSKKFFKLQDMLGFDKASKTVEWLLMKSNLKIQELMIPHGKSSFSGVSISESSASKCELLSEYIDGDQTAKCSSRSNRKAKKKTRRGVRTSSYLLRPLAKEAREMARKRARERTLEKSGYKLSCVSGGDDQFSKFRPLCLDQPMDQGMNCLGSWIIKEPEGIIDGDSSSMIGSWSPSFLFDYQQTGVHPQEHQFSDFQIHGNLWDLKN